MEFAKIWHLTCHNWVKYWPRTQNNTTNREYSARAICWSFPRSSTTLRLETPRGGVAPTPPPLHWRRWQSTVYGRGLREAKTWFGLASSAFRGDHDLSGPPLDSQCRSLTRFGSGSLCGLTQGSFYGSTRGLGSTWLEARLGFFEARLSSRLGSTLLGNYYSGRIMQDIFQDPGWWSYPAG